MKHITRLRFSARQIDCDAVSILFQERLKTTDIEFSANKKKQREHEEEK